MSNATRELLEQHFDIAFAAPDGIKKLRELILTLAMQGKLVPQDANDPPASELLKEIAAEKRRLVKEGKIKAPKPLPDIKSEEVPYALPQGWEWCELQDIFALVTDGDHQAPPQSETGIPFLVIGNLNTGKVTLNGCRYVPEEYYTSLDWARKPTCGDILYTVTGSYGIPVLIETDEKFCVQRHVAILKSSDSTPFAYIRRFLGSTSAFQFATAIATGIAQKTVPLSGLRTLRVPLPPLPEQHRIVAKIDQLMALCDTLEQRIGAANGKQAELLDALMAAA
jgi:type I restriction enzyme S subunit